MNSKFFKIGGIVFEFQSESEIADSEMFAPFITERQKADAVIKIAEKSPLEIKGKLINAYSNKEVYEYNGKKLLYSYYPEFGNGKIYYSCSESGKDSAAVTVDYKKQIYDSMLFDSFDFPGMLISRSRFLFHCSFIIINGKAILFSGSSGKGKSTQAELWNKFRNAEIINGDRAILRMKSGKLWAYGTPYCGSSRISVNKTAEVAAIFFPEHSEKSSVMKIDSSFETVPLLLSQMTLENNENAVNALLFAENLFKTVPLFSMPCVPDETAVEAAENELKKSGIL